MHDRIAYGFVETPRGEALVAATDKGLCWLVFADARDEALQELEGEYPKAALVQMAHPLHTRALAVFEPGDRPQIPLHLKGTPFQLKVWQALLSIPEGRLQSYGQLAAAIGQPAASRAVGSAVGRNPVAVLIPCHRVIRESGVIGGYRWQRGRKLALLARELSAHDEQGIPR